MSVALTRKIFSAIAMPVGKAKGPIPEELAGEISATAVHVWMPAVYSNHLGYGPGI